MKIGHYAPGLSLPGGISSYVRRVVAGQLRRGHEITLFDRRRAGVPPAGTAFGAVEVSETSDDADLLRQARFLDVLHTHAVVDAPASFEGRATAFVRTMHGHEAYCPSGTRHLALPASRPCPRGYHLAGCAWGHLVNHCGSVRPRHFLEDFARVRRERESAKRFFTIAISDFVRGQMIRAGYDPARIQVIHNPAPASLPELTNQPLLNAPPCFLFLGRLVPEKGARWLLQAAALVNEPFRLEIAGQGPQESSLRRLASRLQLESKVHWLGWLDEAGVRARLDAARAVIFPSLWHEPAGLVTAEAAARGRAVVAGRVGGIPEYAAILGNVVLVEPGDTAGLAEAIRALIRDPVLAARLGSEGWQNITQGALSLDTHLDTLDDIYTRCQTPSASSSGPSPCTG